MVWVPLSNGDGQVIKGIKLKNPDTGTTHTVASTSRKGINRYEITFEDGSKVFNHEIRKKKSSPGWGLVGRFHTPEEIAKIYGRKLDPDANSPRPMRASFWKMKSKPGTHNYRQKKKLMKDPTYIKKFSEFFHDTLHEGENKRIKGGDPCWDNYEMIGTKKVKGKQVPNCVPVEEGAKDGAGKDVFVKKIAKSAGVGYKAAGAIAAAAGRKRLGNAEFQRRVEAGQKAARRAKAQGKKYKG